MEKNIFGSSDLICILSFLATYKQVCNPNGIHDGAAMWCGKNFTTRSAAASLGPCLYVKNKKSLDSPEGIFLGGSREPFPGDVST